MRVLAPARKRLSLTDHVDPNLLLAPGTLTARQPLRLQGKFALPYAKNFAVELSKAEGPRSAAEVVLTL